MKGKGGKVAQGLFRKDLVKELRYDLNKSVVEELKKMKGNDMNSERENFRKVLKEMKINKHFKEFFLFHEQSLQKGLTEMDHRTGHSNHFKRQFLESLA